MIQCLKSNSRGHSSVTYHGDRFPVFFTFVFCCHCHTQGCRNGGRGMAYSECVIFAFASFWKTTQSFILPVSEKIIAAACENFMAISLVTNIPNQLVIRSIENIVKSYCQFNHTQASPKMSSVYAYHINNILTKLVRKLVKFFAGKFLQIFG